MPYAGEVSRIRISIRASLRRGRSVVGDRGAIASASHGGGKSGILYSRAGADVENVVPGRARVIRGSDSRSRSIIRERKINAAVVVDSHRRVVTAAYRARFGRARAVLDRFNRPGNSVVG